jgi:hypothetical protein
MFSLLAEEFMKSRSIRIFRLPIPPGSNLEAIMLEAYRQAGAKFPQETGVLDASGPVTIDGLPAYQKTYRVYSGEPAYELRDIWVQKDQEQFIVSRRRGWGRSIP